MQEPYARQISAASSIEINKVLRNTYLLLSMTLLFSALTAGVAMAIGIGRGTGLIMSLVALGLSGLCCRVQPTLLLVWS